MTACSNKAHASSFTSLSLPSHLRLILIRMLLSMTTLVEGFLYSVLKHIQAGLYYVRLNEMTSNFLHYRFKWLTKAVCDNVEIWGW